MADTTTPAEDSSASQLTPAPLERAAAEDSSAGPRENPSRVKTVQRILGVTQTGKMGKPTRDALSAYQLAASLPVTGRLDAQTWKRLSS